jgi:hypothetical protein
MPKASVLADYGGRVCISRSGHVNGSHNRVVYGVRLHVNRVTVCACH